MRGGKFITVVVVGVIALVGCGGGNSGGPAPTSSTAYKGHESDIDMQNFCAAHPSVIGTRLDDCQTCHRAGEVVDLDDEASTLNPCSYCHLIAYPDPDIKSGAPTGYADTLNPYGADYLYAGRSRDACLAIAPMDSDADTHANDAEIAAGRYPGDETSMPGQAWAPIYTFEFADVTALTEHTQYLLMNSHRQKYDNFANYRGVKIVDLLAAAGVSLSGATGITVIAPDGYQKDFTLDEMSTAYPTGIYWGGLDSFPNPDHSFVTYPPPGETPPGLTDGGTISGEQWLTIAHHHDGLLLDPGYLDEKTGKIAGEGPYRLIVPQTTPGTPDRGVREAPIGDGWDYDDNKDHNAGLCVRSVVAIRVNPMPAGVEEFDWKNGGFALLSAKRIILYGHGVTGN